MRLSNIKYWFWDRVLVMRPLFLLASVFLFSIGVLSEGSSSDLLEPAILAGLAAVVLVHVSCHLVNEYADWMGDRFARHSLFAGGSGVVATGKVPPATALAMAIGAISLAIALTLWVMEQIPGRGAFLIIILFSVVLGWYYSLRPIRLVNSGLGEAMVALLLAFGIPFAGGYLVRGSIELPPLYISLPLFLFAFAALIAVEYPDKQADVRSGKRNLTYRLGIRRAAMLQSVSLYLGYAVLLIAMLLGDLGLVNALLFLLLPFGWAAGTMMASSKYYDYNMATTSTSIIMVTFGLSIILMLVDKMI